MKPLIINQDSPIILGNKKDVIKVVLYIKMLQHGLRPFENDLNILYELFAIGGYEGDKEKEEFYKTVIDNDLRKSNDSINNKITEFVAKGILARVKKNSIRFNEEFLPTLNESPSLIGFISKITHAV